MIMLSSTTFRPHVPRFIYNTTTYYKKSIPIHLHRCNHCSQRRVEKWFHRVACVHPRVYNYKTIYFINVFVMTMPRNHEVCIKLVQLYVRNRSFLSFWNTFLFVFKYISGVCNTRCITIFHCMSFSHDTIFKKCILTTTISAILLARLRSFVYTDVIKSLNYVIKIVPIVPSQFISPPGSFVFIERIMS